MDHKTVYSYVVQNKVKWEKLKHTKENEIPQFLKSKDISLVK